MKTGLSLLIVLPWQECAIEIDWIGDDPSVQIPETPGECLCKGIALPHYIGLNVFFTFTLLYISFFFSCELCKKNDHQKWPKKWKEAYPLSMYDKQ